MDFTFQKFQNNNKRNEARITVTRHKSFGFPTKFHDDNKLAEYKYVVLYYDETKKAVGFHFTSDDAEPHKFSIIRSKKQYGGSVVASSFFATYNIDPNLYHGRYEYEKKEYPDIGLIYSIVLKENQSEKEVPKDDVGSPPATGPLP